MTADATATAQAIADGSLTSTEAVTRALARVGEVDGGINAFTVLFADEALRRAAEVDAGTVRGPLAGVPISVKDHVWLAGAPATNGSRALQDFIAPLDCVAVSRLLEAGAVVVGKTNNPEFCYRGVTDNDLHGVTRNPRNPERTAGGSSGGAAASVAAGMTPLAVGTDGGGSIRIPAAFCGVYGLKPTFGLVPKMPGFRGWPSLSVTGPIAASVRDLALALQVMAGPSPADQLSFPYPGDYLAAVQSPSWQGVRVAVSADLGFAELDADVRAVFDDTIEKLAAAGAQLTAAHPDPIRPSPLWDAIALPEGLASEGELLARTPDLVGSDATAIIEAGRGQTTLGFIQAQHDRGQLYQAWVEFFEHHDVLLTPTLPVTAFETGRLAPSSVNGKPVPPEFDAWCELLLPANLAGLPAASIPMGVGADGLPVGLQIIGARGQDAAVLQAAAAADATLRL